MELGRGETFGQHCRMGVVLRTQALVEEFLTESEYRQLARKAISAQLWALDKLARAFPDLPHDPGDLLGFIASQELSPQSRHDQWSRLRTFWRWAEREGKARNTMSRVPAPQLRRRLPRALNRDEIGQLFEVASSRRDRALMAIPLDTGIRLGELVSLVWPRVQDSGLLVTGKTGDRTVPISSHVRELMAGLGDEHHTWTGLKGPLTHYGVQGAIPRVMNRAGITPPKAGPHVLRHTFGLHYVLAGGDPFSLQQIMGHRNIQSTMIYVYMSNQHLNERHARFSPLAAFKFD